MMKLDLHRRFSPMHSSKSFVFFRTIASLLVLMLVFFIWQISKISKTSIFTLTKFHPYLGIPMELDQWMDRQELIAYYAILRNIGDSGEFAKDIGRGVVIASPSTSDPDYYYQWTRDAAIVFKVLLNSYIHGHERMKHHLYNYVEQSVLLQHTQNPSGGYTTGGLGEPKFMVNSTPFEGEWKRPQNDGPAIRSIVLIKLAKLNLDVGNKTYVTKFLYNTQTNNTAIKADLEHIARHWRIQQSYDIWEEVTGLHFFNLMVQHRALIEGSEFAALLGDKGISAWYKNEAQAIKAELRKFWDPLKGQIIATLNNNDKVRAADGLDCATFLGSLHGNGAKGYGIYQANSEEVLATFEKMVKKMIPLYPINLKSNAPGVAIGRYASDIYDGVGISKAHPWFICTFTMAETLYTAVSQFQAQGYISVSNATEQFFRKFYPSVTAGERLKAKTREFDQVIHGMRQYGDSFAAMGRKHLLRNGSISEQFGREDGLQKGARDLTWSYASFLTMRFARMGTIAY